MLLWTVRYKFFCEYRFLFLLGISLRVTLLNYMKGLWLTTWECLPKWWYHFYIPSSSVWKFCSLLILYTFIIISLFDDSCLSECGVVSHCGFNVHFPDDFSYAYSLFGHPPLWSTLLSKYFGHFSFRSSHIDL